MLSRASAYAGYRPQPRLASRPSQFGCSPCADSFCHSPSVSSNFPRGTRKKGGLYVWTREAYGEFSGFMAAWTYWMSNLPFFPELLYFGASSLLFTGPRAQRLAASHSYYLIFMATMLAVITVLNVIGLNTGKWVNNLGAVGTVVSCFPAGSGCS
ncbi:MAG: amino acid permease [Bryobacteraceae bacterium]